MVLFDKSTKNVLINLNTTLLEKAINRCKWKKRGGRNIGYVLAESILNVVYSSAIENN